MRYTVIGMFRSSLARIRASRANGARSRGPKTIAGKQSSSRNALRHGLLAKQVVLANEAAPNFDIVVAQHIRRFGPADGVELGMIEEMASAFWRLRRAWAIETNLMDQGVEAAQPRGELSRIAAAFSALADTPQLALLHRYEARLHRMYQRSMNTFLLLHKTKLPNEPRSPFESSDMQDLSSPEVVLFPTRAAVLQSTLEPQP
jgi:hypothetical protein